MKTIKAKVEVVKVKKSKSRGEINPWEVHSVIEDGHHCYDACFRTKSLAEKYIRNNQQLVSPVIVHIDIPRMEY